MKNLALCKEIKNRKTHLKDFTVAKSVRHLTIGSWFVRMSRYETGRKFGEHERGVKSCAMRESSSNFWSASYLDIRTVVARINCLITFSV